MMSKNKRLILTGRLIAVLTVMLFLPVMLNAGDLNPPGAPAPTMKTLDQIPPAWSHKLPASERFVLVLDGEAVLDKETGLVWEKAPAPDFIPKSWESSVAHCLTLSKGGRRGWHIPTAEQLLSLVDPTTQYPSLALPNGHPFGYVDRSFYYWSSTTSSNDPGRAWLVKFINEGFSNISTAYKGPETSALVWCVRGGQSHDGY
jgi:hypothetical protein